MDHPDRAPAYVDPESKPPLEVDRLLEEWRSLPFRMRLLLTFYLLIGAFGGLGGGLTLTSSFHNWLTWSISLLILEPIGLTSLGALIYFNWPNSFVGRVFQGALHRAKAALLIIGVLIVGGFLLAAGYFVSELLRSQ